MQTEQLRVTGMTCGGCVSKVTRALQAVPGVQHVSVSLGNQQATVQYDAERTAPAQLATAITGAGFGLGHATASAAKGGCC